MKPYLHLTLGALFFIAPVVARGEGDWETTPASEAALARGLAWLERNQGPQGNWESNDLGLVSMGALAFLAAGRTPGIGKQGQPVERALGFVLSGAQPNGLLNISSPGRAMYNHGLATFVLGQAHGMTADPRINGVLDRSLKLIVSTQADDGGWDYTAEHKARGHDLSLAVMQAKALRSAVDSGLDVPPEVIEMAIKSVRGYYRAAGGGRGMNENAMKKLPGQFTYAGSRTSTAMQAAGVVCLQEFGQYDDWRIAKNMTEIERAVAQLKPTKGGGTLPMDAYTLYYVGQALYQVGGEPWKRSYPKLRDAVVASQYRSDTDRRRDGHWRDSRHVGGKPGELYGTAVACFILAIPNRYLPILQEGKIDRLQERFKK